MKMIIASFLTTVLIVAMTLGAMFILVQATEYVTSLESPLRRAAALGAELLLGLVLLLGKVCPCTHVAPRIFAPEEQTSPRRPGDCETPSPPLSPNKHRPKEPA